MNKESRSQESGVRSSTSRATRLPARFIKSKPAGWEVTIERGGIRFYSYVPFQGDKDAAWKKALAIRDEYLAAHRDYTYPSHSNTGVAGVTEMTHWSRGRGTTCFVVTHGWRPRALKRFRYKTTAERATALRAALAHRARLAGESLAVLVQQNRKMEGIYV